MNLSSQEILDEDPTITEETARKWLDDHGGDWSEFKEDHPVWIDSSATVLEWLGY